MSQTVKELFQGNLRDTLSHFPANHASLLEAKVTGVTSDSRKVRPGSIFVAICGEAHDGHQFLQAAEQAGAILVIAEKNRVKEDQIQSLRVPLLSVEDGRWVLAQLAAEFFGHPSKKMLMIGVTGTSGKTTTSYLLESILRAASYQVGVIGTVNFRFGSKVLPSSHTTPGVVEIQELLYQMWVEGCSAVVLEVSSHALKQRRVASVAFDGMVFTNLSAEHLDYHLDMEDYFLSKSLLFTEVATYSQLCGKKPVGVVCDDAYGHKLLDRIRDCNSPCQAHFSPQALAVQITAEGIGGEFSGIQVTSALTGQFNVSNIACAVSLALALKIRPSFIQQGIAALKGVPGRLEKVENRKNIHVWVDYAHKPDALEKVIQTLRDFRSHNRLITVFGCGGDRDAQKRPVMGRIAVQGSDLVWITSDNPRTENPMEIIREILVGTDGFQNWRVEEDRKKAIFQAIECAKPGDLVLIAGKGHENYQILGMTRISFDDREIAREALGM